MDGKRRKLMTYSDRHLRRLASKDASFVVNATTQESSSDSYSENEVGCSDSRLCPLTECTPDKGGVGHEPNYSTDLAASPIHIDIDSDSSIQTTDSSCSSLPSDESIPTGVGNIERRPIHNCPTKSFKEDIVQWATRYKIPHNALSSLLRMNNKHTEFNLPG